MPNWAWPNAVKGMHVGFVAKATLEFVVRIT